MNVYIPLGLILFLLTILARGNERSSRNAFVFSFVAMFIFAALRYEFGPDYIGYREEFDFLKGSDIETYLESYHYHMEIMFVRFFNLFNSYFIYIMVMSLMWHAVMFWFFKKYVSFRYYHIVILMMFLNVNLCLMNYIAFRSSLASCFFFIALVCLASGPQDVPIIGKSTIFSHGRYKNLFLYLLFVYIGSLFHTSLLFFGVFPFVTKDTNYSKQLSNTLLFIGLIIAFVMPIVGSGFFDSITLRFLDLFPDYFERYEGYLRESSSGGFGAIIFGLSKVAVSYPILQALTVEKDSQYRRVMQFSIVFIFLMLVFNNNYLSRFMMCFYPVIIVAFLRSFLYISDEYKYLALFSLLLLSVTQFYAVINSPSSISFLSYNTIFSAPNWQ